MQLGREEKPMAPHRLSSLVGLCAASLAIAASLPPTASADNPSWNGEYAITFMVGPKDGTSVAASQPESQHTCASLAVSAGVNVLALARMLGHKDPSVTLRVYADLFDDDLDAVAVTLHTRYSRSSVGKVWAQAASDDPSQSHDDASTSANSPEM